MTREFDLTRLDDLEIELDDFDEEDEDFASVPDPRSLLHLLLKDQDEAFRNRVWELVVQCDLDLDDPMFLILVSTGQLQALLERYPKQFTELFTGQWRTFKSMLVDERKSLNELFNQSTLPMLLRNSPKELRELFDAWSGQIHAELEAYKNVAVKVQQTAVAKSVDSLIQQAERTKLLASKPKLAAALAVFTGVLTIGAIFGAACTIAYQNIQTQFDPKTPSLISLRQRNLLQWAESREGQQAKQMMEWNRDLLDRNLCQQQAKSLGVTLQVEVGGAKATSGFCTLWVVKPSDRTFAPSQASK